MIVKRFIYEIFIKRPLVFLCGPNGGDDNVNRRVILDKYITKNIREKDRYNAFPIIVDDLFKISQLKEHSLVREISVTLLEEIISAIAYRTYIFLDTMSTSYELGQFVNSRTKNKVRIFVDDEYSTRLFCPIGAYIKDSFKIDTDEIIYKANYDSKGRIYFKNNKVPKVISDAIKEDFCNYHNVLKFNFKDSDDAYYDVGSNSINIKLDIKHAFYLIAGVAERKGIILTNSWSGTSELSLYGELYNELVEEIRTNYLFNSNNRDVFFNTPKVNIKIENYDDADQILYHMFYILRIISFAKKGFKSIKKVLNGKDIAISKSLAALTMDFKSICRFTDKDLDTIDNYFLNPDRYVYEFRLKMHGKYKNIVTYKDNVYGKSLRKVHEKIDYAFSKILKTSSSSFAYKKGLNTVACLKENLDYTYFAKLDIKSYFGSIRYLKLYSMIKRIIDTYRWLYIDAESDLSIVLRACFYKHRLPIGFVTSPRLSDFYLYNIDEIMLSKSKAKYTRYADDVLIASNNSMDEVNESKRIFINLLKNLSLDLNDKCIDKSLIHEGDSIGFLGANIVKSNKGNYLTISNKHLIQISKEFERRYHAYLIDKDEKKRFDNIFNYVKYVSQKSYFKLKKIIKIKTGHSID